MNNNKSKVKKKTSTKIVIFILIVIATFSGFNIGKKLYSYYQNQKTYDELSNIAGDEINWDELKKINPDIVAWIRIPDTNIDYPVVSANDNDKYLHTKFNGEYGDCGTLFVDANTENPFKQFSTIIYGHHMKDGSMFHDLKKFKETSFFRNHPTYELLTPDKNYTVEIIDFYNSPATSKLYNTKLKKQEAIDSYVELLNKNAHLLQKNSDIKNTDRVVLLSTCAYEYKNARYVLSGKLIEK